MIELFDAARLLPRKDHTLAAAGAVLVLGVAGLGAYAFVLQQQWQRVDAERQALATRLARAAPPPTPGDALLGDLQRQTESLESEVAAAGGAAGGAAAALSPSQWMARLDALGVQGGSDVSLSLAEIDRAGSARIEGQARTPQALGQYVQAWEQQDRLAAVPARTIDVKQDVQAAPLLRFQLRAVAARPARFGVAP